MPQKRQEKELLKLSQEKRKQAIPGEDASLSLKSMTQQGGYPQIKKLLKILKLLKWGYCLWVTQMATAGQPQHFHPCCPGGWVRPSTASNHPSLSRIHRIKPQLSSLMVWWWKTFSGFSCAAFAWTISAEHHCPNPEHLSSPWSLLPWGDPSLSQCPNWNHRRVLFCWKC